MQKEIRELITKDGQKIWQITTSDERFYGKQTTNPTTGLPEIIWLPSVTWIKNYYYTSPYLVRWIADKGLTESERIKKEAGTRGDKIHQATEQLEKDGEIRIEDKFLNKETGQMEELTAEELEAVISYKDFIDDTNAEILTNEMTVFSEKYAGTLDRIFRINGQIYIIDLKSSQSIRKDMIIQLSAYSHTEIDYTELGITDEEWKARKLAVLQLGYQKNSKKYKFTEIEDRYDLFKLAYSVWQEENPDAKPKQKDFPLVIKLQRSIANQKRVKKLKK